MNPVLLKPGSDRRSHVVLRGRPHGTLEAGEYATGRRPPGRGGVRGVRRAGRPVRPGRLRGRRVAGRDQPAGRRLREPRSGPPLRAAGHRGRRHRPGRGASPRCTGPVALLEEADRALIAGLRDQQVPRGPVGARRPGSIELTRRTGVPFAGVLPWLADVWLDAEDTLEIGGWRRPWSQHEADLRVAVVRLPRVSNATDVDALAAEPGVEVLVTTDPGVVAGADLAVLPGSRATVQRPGLAARTRARRRRSRDRARRGAPVLGHLRRLPDAGRDDHPTSVESRLRCRPGSDLLPGHDHVRGREGARAAGRCLARAPGHRVRDPPRCAPTVAAGAPSRSWTAAGPVRSGARCGTARSRTTGSGGPG